MRIKQHDISDLPRLNTENLERIFSVNTDEQNRYYYNLLETVHVPDNLPDSLFIRYTVAYGDTWPFISYKVYDSPNAWWLILQANNIINPTIQPVPGTELRCYNNRVASEILNNLG